jgi:acyl-CoA thioester hydrolase
MAFTYSVDVRFNDCDGMKHVNNAVYLTYVEEARIAFLVSLRQPGDRSFASRGLIHARTEIDYVSPTFYGKGPVEIEVAVLDVGTKSARLGYTMRQDGTVVARAQTVTVGYDGGASRALNDVERTGLEAHLVRV